MTETINPALEARQKALDKVREHLKAKGLYKEPYNPGKEPYQSANEPPEGEPIDPERIPF